jgi:hypothetical protein
MANSYSVLLECLENSNSHSIFEFEDKIKFITGTYMIVINKVKKSVSSFIAFKVEIFDLAGNGGIMTLSKITFCRTTLSRTTNKM